MPDPVETASEPIHCHVLPFLVRRNMEWSLTLSMNCSGNAS